jgi:glutamate dehydrogenase
LVWLGDAFASGGSAGYDHKKMGIGCARAGNVKRHFRDGHRHHARLVSGRYRRQASGDVFGNGMPPSPQIRLFMAFDHRHIPIDPDPDSRRSFANGRPVQMVALELGRLRPAQSFGGWCDPRARP